MSSFTAIDLSKLPAPSLIHSVDEAALLADMVARYSLALPELADKIQLESDPIRKLLQLVAYEKALFNSSVNQGGRAVMLAFAAGADLDQLAALVPLTRREGEKDDAFRARVQLAPEGFSTAGPEGGYQAIVSNADARVLDVYVDTYSPEHTDPDDPQRGDVHLYVLASETGELPTEVSTIIEAALNDDVRPLTDHVTVRAPAVVNYSVAASLQVGPGPDAETVRLAAEAAVTSYVASTLELGGYVTRVGLTAALVVGGVLNVQLNEPAIDIQANLHAVPVCTSINITLQGAA